MLKQKYKTIKINVPNEVPEAKKTIDGTSNQITSFRKLRRNCTKNEEILLQTIRK